MRSEFGSVQKIDLLLRWIANHQMHMCPHLGGIPRGRYPGTMYLPKEQKKKEGNSEKCTCSLFISSSIPDVSVWPKGSCTCTCTKKTKRKKEEDCLSSSTSKSSSSIHFSTYSQTKLNISQFLINIFFLFPSPSQTLLWKKNYANKKERPRDLHFAQGPFCFCAHTHIGCDVGSRGVGM